MADNPAAPHEIIFHHYPQSPVSEKVRVAFGIKQAAWHSVEIPRIPPKPELMPLTGGYRRTPVMQIGADIYCDSLCILQELERRLPEPSFFPDNSTGISWGLSRWTDDEFFGHAIRLVLGSGVDDIPADFAADRGRLYMGPDWDLQAQQADMPHILSQINAQLALFETQLAPGNKFMTADQPGLADALCYYLVWFIRGRWPGGPAFLSRFPRLEDWENRITALGHGRATEMSAKTGLEIARSTECTTAEGVAANDPQDLAVGMVVDVAPDVDGGDPKVEGELRFADQEQIAILHENEQVGRVCIHFPRVGYRISILE